MRPDAEWLVTGRIATLAGEEGFGWVEALAVGEGRVLAAGRRAEIEPLAGPSTRAWRLDAGHVVMPAMTDAHIHLTMVAAARGQVDLSAASDLEAYLALIGAAHERLLAAGDRNSWILGHGWSPAHIEGWPDARMLERVAPGRSIALWAHDHHSRWVSATALARAGINRDTPDPDGGVIQRDAGGEPIGVLSEAAAGLLDGVVPLPGGAQLEPQLLALAGDLLALGVVACHDPNELDVDAGVGIAQQVYRGLAEEGRLPLRIHASIREHHLTAALAAGLRSGDGVAAAAADDPLARRRAERYRMGWLKLFADGSLGSRSAALLEPYSDAAERPPTGGPAGMFVAGREELADYLRRAWAGGISAQVHAIGDAAVRLALDLLAGQPPLLLAPRIEHAQLVSPSDVARFGALDVAASIQPIHLRSDAGMARRSWGERAEHAFPIGGALAGGALVPFGTDAPVEPIDPWPGIAVAISRRDPYRPADQPLGREHAIDLAQALRSACLHPALVAGETDRGQLVAGQRADLLVVPAQLFEPSADAAAVADTRPLATLLDGEIVHRDPLFDPL
ncbi:amidohydrolase [soil metagenome]